MFGVLLVAEYLLISLLFDARSLHGRKGGLGLLGYLGDAATIALVVAAATLTLMGRELRAAVATLPRIESSRRTLVLGSLAHALAYGAFLMSSGHVFGSAGGGDPGAMWVEAWMLSGIAVAATWLPLALPWPALRVLLPRLTTALLLGGAAGAVAWVAGGLSAVAWTWLGPWTLAAVAWLLHLAVEPVWVDAPSRLIGTPYFDVHVSDMCSGFEGIGLIVTFLGSYIFLERKSLRFPRVLWLLPVAVVTVWCANALRIALLILVGSFISPALAISGFHSKAGWLFFCIVALGFIALTRRSRYFAVADAAGASAGEAGTENIAAPYLMPLLAWLAVALVTGLFTVDFDRFYPVRVGCVLAVLWSYRAHYARLPWRLHGDSVALGVVVFALWRLLAADADAKAVGQLQAGLGELAAGWGVLWLIARAIGMTFVIPIVEELAFRGYLLRRLTSADFDLVDARKIAPWAWVISSVAFGAVHGADWLPGMLAGLAFALAQQRRGHVTDAITAHAVANLLLSLDAFLLGNLRWWA